MSVLPLSQRIGKFIGKEWIDHLRVHHIPFFIRFKANQQAKFGKNQTKPLKEFFKHLDANETRHLYHLFEDEKVFTVGKKIKDELWIICSNVSDEEKVLNTYKKRWDIERLFKNMKTQGFNLEDTHMKDLKRLSKLMALIAVAVVLCCAAGGRQKSPFKKTIGYPLYSFFTRGLRALKIELFSFIFTLFSTPPPKSEG